MSQVPPPRGFASTLRMVGPGLVVAATGVSAGDLVAAANAGLVLSLLLFAWLALNRLTAQFLKLMG